MNPQLKWLLSVLLLLYCCYDLVKFSDSVPDWIAPDSIRRASSWKNQSSGVDCEKEGEGQREGHDSVAELIRALNQGNASDLQKQVQMKLSQEVAAHERTRKELSEAKSFSTSLLDELQHSYSNYLIHTPKTGGYSLFRMLNAHRGELSVVQNRRVGYKLDNNGNICNHAIASVEKWQEWPKCWLHSTESHFSTEPGRRFAMVRNPHHHVPSMYYHCTEAKEHLNRAHFMPETLDAWVEAWVKKIQSPDYKRPTDVQPGRSLANEYRCYNPHDLQSRYMGFTNSTELTHMYEVVGLTEEMTRTSCLISIAIHEKVPKKCNCTGVDKEVEVIEEARSDHGVKHHGDTVELSERALAAIDTLTRNDAILFQAAQRLFREKIAYVEDRYSFQMC